MRQAISLFERAVVAPTLVRHAIPFSSKLNCKVLIIILVSTIAVILREKDILVHFVALPLSVVVVLKDDTGKSVQLRLITLLMYIATKIWD